MTNEAEQSLNSPNKVVSLAKFKEDKIKNESEDLLMNYFNLLGVNELIFESKEVITNLKNGTLDYDLAVKTKIMLKEFRKRLYKEVPNVEKSVKDYIQNTEEKLKKIKKKL